MLGPGFGHRNFYPLSYVESFDCIMCTLNTIPCGVVSFCTETFFRIVKSCCCILSKVLVVFFKECFDISVVCVCVLYEL